MYSSNREMLPRPETCTKSPHINIVTAESLVFAIILNRIVPANTAAWNRKSPQGHKGYQAVFLVHAAYRHCSWHTHALNLCRALKHHIFGQRFGQYPLCLFFCCYSV